jgi:hypothetical protein
MKQKEMKTPKENTETMKPRPFLPRRKQAVILDRFKGKVTYADMVREVKKTALDENLLFEITIRKAKSGNVTLEIPSKEQADSLAEFLKGKLGETASIRRPSPSVLFLMGVEDSVEETELRKTLEAFDNELKEIKNVVIRESKN